MKFCLVPTQFLKSSKILKFFLSVILVPLVIDHLTFISSKKRWTWTITVLLIHVMRCAIWYHFRNLRCFSHFLNCGNGTKSRNAFHMLELIPKRIVFTPCNKAIPRRLSARQISGNLHFSKYYHSLHIIKFSENNFQITKSSLREKCPHSEFFWLVFPHIQTEHGKIRTRKTPTTDTFQAVVLKI